MLLRISGRPFWEIEVIFVFGSFLGFCIKSNKIKKMFWETVRAREWRFENSWGFRKARRLFIQQKFIWVSQVNLFWLSQFSRPRMWFLQRKETKSLTKDRFFSSGLSKPEVLFTWIQFRPKAIRVNLQKPSQRKSYYFKF